MGRLAVLVALLVSLGGSAFAKKPVVVDADAELRFLNRINLERAERGLPALARDARLERLARFHSADMAMNEFVGLSSPDAGSLLDRASVQGRVGRVDLTAQVASGTDFASVGAPLLDPSVTRVGVGIVAQDGRLWLTQLAVADDVAVGAGTGASLVAGGRGPAYARPDVSALITRLRAAFENLGVPVRFAFLWR